MGLGISIFPFEMIFLKSLAISHILSKSSIYSFIGLSILLVILDLLFLVTSASRCLFSTRKEHLTLVRWNDQFITLFSLSKSIQILIASLFSPRLNFDALITSSDK